MLAIDVDSAEPLHEQIVRGLRRAIASRKVRVGDALPSVRQLAGDLGVNLNTVARAYRRLEDDGLVRVRHGLGAVVANDQVAGADRARSIDELESALAQALADARLRGLTHTDVRRAAERALKKDAAAPARPPAGAKS